MDITSVTQNQHPASFTQILHLWHTYDIKHVSSLSPSFIHDLNFKSELWKWGLGATESGQYS